MCQLQDQSQKRRKLTLYNHVLTSLLVPLALTTNLVGKAMILVAKGLTLLAYLGPHCQLALSTDDQQEAKVKKIGNLPQ